MPEDLDVWRRQHRGRYRIGCRGGHGGVVLIPVSTMAVRLSFVGRRMVVVDVKAVVCVLMICLMTIYLELG